MIAFLIDSTNVTNVNPIYKFTFPTSYDKYLPLLRSTKPTRFHTHKSENPLRRTTRKRKESSKKERKRV